MSGPRQDPGARGLSADKEAEAPLQTQVWKVFFNKFTGPSVTELKPMSPRLEARG